MHSEASNIQDIQESGNPSRWLLSRWLFGVRAILTRNFVYIPMPYHKTDHNHQYHHNHYNHHRHHSNVRGRGSGLHRESSCAGNIARRGKSAPRKKRITPRKRKMGAREMCAAQKNCVVQKGCAARRMRRAGKLRRSVKQRRTTSCTQKEQKRRGAPLKTIGNHLFPMLLRGCTVLLLFFLHATFCAARFFLRGCVSF